MSRVLDTSVILAVFDREDPRRPETLDALRDPTATLVPPEVLTETLGVAHGRMGYEVGRAIREDLADLGNIVFLNSTAQERVGPIFEQADGSLSWTDAAVVAHCLVEDAVPLCFDPAIEQAFSEERD